jgi:signal peptidase I
LLEYFLSFAVFWLFVLVALGGLHQWIRRRHPQSWDETAAHTLFWTASAIFIVRMFMVAPYMTDGPSMIPTLPSHSLVLVDKLSYGFVWPFVDVSSGTTTPNDGEVVAFVPPKMNSSSVWIKRVRARPGDWVDFRPSQGWFVNDEWVAPPTNRSAGIWEKWDRGQGWGGELGPKGRRLPQGVLFLIGDNIHDSSDSRDMGLVPVINLLGRVVWPRQVTDSSSFVSPPPDVVVSLNNQNFPRFQGWSIGSSRAGPSSRSAVISSDLGSSL